MEVLTAILCDSAADYNGKLCILGAFDTIFAQRFPAFHPQCALALRFLFRHEDEGMHRFQVSFIDSDGKSVLPQEGAPRFELDVKEIPEKAFFISQNFVINLQGLPLNKPGQYSFDVLMDQELAVRIPLQVVQVAPQPGAPQQGPAPQA